MNVQAPIAEFYAPDTKELGLGAAYVLAQEGGQLTFDRVAEVLGDVLQIPEHLRNRPHPRHASHSEWTYCLAWACSTLRQTDFMEKNDSDTRGMCILNEHGHELGRWADRIYSGDCPELPDWVAAFVSPVFSRMKKLLTGGNFRKPPDYEICRWIRYCYLLNQAQTGVALFSLVLADNVDANLFRQAERQARVLKLRIEEHGERDSTEVAKAFICDDADNDEFRRWMMESFPRGTTISTLVRSSQNTIQEYTDDGIVIFSSRSQRDAYVPWDAMTMAYAQLKSTGTVDHREIAGRGTFICSVLARLPGAQVVPGQATVRLINGVAQAVLGTES